MTWICHHSSLRFVFTRRRLQRDEVVGKFGSTCVHLLLYANVSRLYLSIGGVGAKWSIGEMGGGEGDTGCLGKSVLRVVLLLYPRDFRHWPVWSWSSISLILWCQAMPQQGQTYRRSHFKYHTKTQFPHIRAFWCINSLTFRRRLLRQSNYVP